MSPDATSQAVEPAPAIPAMPERNPKALRTAIAHHAPQLLRDFDDHWKRAIADTYDIGPLPAFMARWWVEYAIARDPELDACMTDLHHRADEATDTAEATALLEEVSRIRCKARETEPGQ
ncbi:DUF6247 family protein [Streptomyces sp. NPDC051320]|uniref:DUF6247 family protein n=1 Tax=Streptomyces sp. NPDC051320 TaxID=3154644 RepID=UPI00341296DA